MLQGWKKIAYAHWPVPVTEVQSRLPEGLLVDTFDGSAWVGLVAFHMERIRFPGTPAIPYFGTFPETNVRTYVTDLDGRPGVWFDSLDVTRMLPVIVARTSYRLPYMWSQMSISDSSQSITYRAQRRWPTARGASSIMTIHRGRPIGSVDPLEAFLTARWGLYTQLGSKLAFAPVEHEPWPLEQASLEYLHDDFVAAAGYDVPGVSPVVHYSEGVDVRIGLPRRVGR
jgi:uncharacterized protein YqjF (DUF2071 family)